MLFHFLFFFNFRSSHLIVFQLACARPGVLQVLHIHSPPFSFHLHSRAAAGVAPAALEPVEAVTGRGAVSPTTKKPTTRTRREGDV